MEQHGSNSNKQPKVSFQQFAATSGNKHVLPVLEVATSNGAGKNDQMEVASGSGITEPHQSGLYNEEDNNLKLVQQRRINDLRNYVQTKLFPYWKFFNSKKQMLFSAKKGSIVLKICNDMHVSKAGRCSWWDMNKKAILSTLNRKWSDVTGYIRMKFIGK